MLVSAFHIDIRDAVRRAVFTVAQHERVGGPGVKPHVEHVEDLLPFVGVVLVAKEALFRTFGVPCICTFRLERFGDAGIHGGITQKEAFVGRQKTFLGEAGQRHTPRALTRQNPIRACLDHRIQTVTAGLRPPLHQLVDRVQGTFTDGLTHLVLPVADLAVHGCKPLRRVAEHDRRFRPPRMRVRVRHAATRDDATSLDQLGNHGVVGFAFLALAIKDLQARKERHVRQEFRFLVHIVGHQIQPTELLKKLIIVSTMGWSCVHEPGPGIVGNVIAGCKWHNIVPKSTGFGCSKSLV